MDSASRSKPSIAIVLCGGASSRMGRPKWNLPIAGRPMLDWVLDAVGVCDETVLSVGHDSSSRPDDRGCRVVADDARHQGPLVGLKHVIASLDTTGDRTVVVVSCDVPLLSRSLVASMIESLETMQDEATMCRVAGRIQPTIAAYRQRPLQRVLDSVDDGRSRMDELALGLRTRFLDIAANVGLNVNTPEDANRAEAEIRVNHP